MWRYENGYFAAKDNRFVREHSGGCITLVFFFLPERKPFVRIRLNASFIRNRYEHQTHVIVVLCECYAPPRPDTECRQPWHWTCSTTIFIGCTHSRGDHENEMTDTFVYNWFFSFAFAIAKNLRILMWLVRLLLPSLAHTLFAHDGWDGGTINCLSCFLIINAKSLCSGNALSELCGLRRLQASAANSIRHLCGYGRRRRRYTIHLLSIRRLLLADSPFNRICTQPHHNHFIAQVAISHVSNYRYR